MLSSPHKENLIALAGAAEDEGERENLLRLASAAGKAEYQEYIVKAHRSLLVVGGGGGAGSGARLRGSGRWGGESGRQTDDAGVGRSTWGRGRGQQLAGR